MRSRPLYDLLSLLARFGVGIVFIAHGWQKIQVGITATSKSFDGLDVPAPTAAAIYSTFTELLCGLALIVGFALPVVGVLLFLDMAGALVFVHAGNGLFLVDQGEVTNGWELVLVLGLASLLFAAGGGGRFTLDSRLFPRRTTAPDDSEPATSAGLWPNDPHNTITRPDVPISPQAATKPIPAPSASSAIATDAPAKRRSRWSLRSRSRSAAQPRSTSEPPEESEPVASSTAAARSTAETEPPVSTPRLAADIIGDPAEDVRVAGQSKRAGGPEKKP